VIRVRLIFAIGVVAALALPAISAAKPAYRVKPKSLHLKVPLPASNGYSAELTTAGHRQVTLSLSKGETIAHYVALGKVTRKVIEADFGDFGRISLRFRSRSRSHPQLIPQALLPPPLRERCKGRGPVREGGIFTGNIRFAGEHGYTEVKASRLKGSVVRSYKRVCKRPGGAAGSKAKTEAESVGLLAVARRGGVQRDLIVGEVSVGTELSLTIAIGGLEEKVGRVAVEKFSLLFDERDSVEISPVGTKPVTAEVKLPKPFEGKASYLEEGSEPASWSGDLKLRLPGSGLVPLAGTEFEADLCHGSGIEKFDRCFKSLVDRSSLAQGSGSHSQPLALARLSSLR
jgi:hypothetical protein